jgi:hypothetical protein
LRLEHRLHWRIIVLETVIALLAVFGATLIGYRFVSARRVELPAPPPPVVPAPASVEPTRPVRWSVKQIGDEIIAQIEQSRRVSQPSAETPSQPRFRAAKGSEPMPITSPWDEDEAETRQDHKSLLAQARNTTAPK